MASPTLLAKKGLRIAVEGCGHGTLHAIYASVKTSCEMKGWDDVDLVIIGGDFQAVRNAHDLKVVSMPEKYRDMCDFHEYYSGARVAPYLTVFVGGNHEASSYLWELYYGGWAAPKIYYLGAANVIRVGPIRIAGLSGIWKGFDYNKPHHERLPYNDDDIRSIYHVRELDTRKLLQIRSPIDIGVSHDWPRGMEWKGNHRQLFNFKKHFEEDARKGQLGSVAATKVLERLRPAYWFSAHMHARYSALWHHEDPADATPISQAEPASAVVNNDGEIALDMEVEPTPVPKNDDEIDLDMDDDDAPQNPNSTSEPKIKGVEGAGSESTNGVSNEVPQDIRDLLPESFTRPRFEKVETLPFPSEITNKSTNFLALDKCLPNRHFLQLLEVEPLVPGDGVQRPLQLQYDREWLAITRVFASALQLGNPDAQVPRDKGDAFYRPLIEKEMDWVEENVVKPGKMTILDDFQLTAPVYDALQGLNVSGQPKEYTNPHTQSFCDLLQIPNAFHASDEEREAMMQQGPRPSIERPGRGGGRGGYRGNNGGRGGGRGRGRDGGRGRGGFNPNYESVGRGRGRW
ncbi:lariat debranching enzyme, C-terminal domain-domain-containing protein [Clohesyomyces aquaticus]|uniref:Lariat debranching enzyme, C-terminal domain-domain-containing protein n=1 Tax=Clohesyomyces aquaticus TaxID=1231657 RepID=A0A1Y1ZU07_9PLEO|nr:lariat debranching enzyme, C-terminal domain-domain-containing protein [Clohesyomyces aquaticus]